MDAWPSGFVATNGVRLHYLRSGGDLPAVVLAHGALDDARCWARVAEALAPDYDVVAVDARGHGCSDAPLDGYELVTQAEDLAGVIGTLGCGGRRSSGTRWARRSRRSWRAPTRSCSAPSCWRTPARGGPGGRRRRQSKPSWRPSRNATRSSPRGRAKR
jgi:hypothetical protein